LPDRETFGPEFTGERVIPGQVDPDLWNEHWSRYLFAGRLSRGKRVLDMGSGAGYGAAYLAETAARVVGLDISAEAVAQASERYTRPNLSFITASCDATGFPDAAFDLIVAYEVIEHLANWNGMLQEAKRLLASGGQFVVSTPNKAYYAESRRLHGPNPFHEHEFEFEEFRSALAAFFPSVSLFVQNHSGAILFQPVGHSVSAEVRLESGAVQPDTSNFFLAVCALCPQTGSPAFLYVPSAANVLREREQHIAKLEAELAQKAAWLQQSQQEHKELVDRHRALTAQLEKSNRWAEETNASLIEAKRRVAQVQEELSAEQAAGRELAEQYNQKIAALEADLAARAQWAIDIEARLTQEVTATSEELAKCVALLDAAEKTVEERTLWAQRLEAERAELERRLATVQGSRWYQLGRKMGLGPEVRNS
jgi:SAM-dependent methyltransferase